MIKLKNKHLKDIAEFLQKMSLKGKKSIHRMRIVNELTMQNEKVAKEELELLRQFSKTDDQGEFIRNEQGNIVIIDVEGFKKEQDELYNEEFKISNTNLDLALNTIKEIVLNYDEELSGKDALAHFLLVEAFEREEGQKK